MQEENNNEQETINQIYEYAAQLLVEEERSPSEVKAALIEQGLSSEDASVVLENLEEQIKEGKKERGKKDMLYGALWCVGGVVASVADIGYYFWGAVLFGGIQFIKGAINTYS